ncbi:amino acid adenylation domain-containing protein [Umezawaea sp. Da 62-37]|uniref:amino acid adenylation domain-containing protein n=1 Tax=Umezawaea sp. Da 62-37 TaxID=3075927 RepID=UPI0028F73EF3|nr:amino acid adenylation domain-containing protein [Umezawaea sp. Da 62-37]WNV87782.1 amino acid adenylation domain-containing protein [Umezawaea sp. Da 62-37]
MPADADSPVARRRVRAELHRPASRGGAPVRAVLLRYADDVADLVLVAHRAVLDTASLRLLVDVLLDRVSAGGISIVTPLKGEGPDAATVKRWRAADYCGTAEWAVGDGAAGDRTGVLETALVGEAADVPATLAVAGALVLGRYAGQDFPVVGLVTGLPERPARALGAFEGRTLLVVDASGARSVVELLGEAARRQPWCDRALYQDLTAQSGGRVFVGVLGTASEVDVDEYVPCQTAPFPLTLVPRVDAGGTTLEVRHRLRDVDAAAAGRFARHVAHVYAQLCAVGPESMPADLELVTGEESAWLSALGRPKTTVAWQPDRIDAVFAARAAERPDAIALTCEGVSTTYAELDARATRFAVGLRANGVRPGDRVGICLDRTADLVAAMIAVLKADAVYVPMDPAHPADRLAYTVEDAGIRVVVTTVDGVANAIAPEALAEHDGTVDPPARGPDSAAYVIYTSGSTGRPKGVVVPHRNVIALLAATRSDFSLDVDDTWTLFHSSAFDFSVWEIWGSLLTGARLVVVPYWVSRSPEEFRALLAVENVTVLSQTPSAFAQLAEADRRRPEPLGLRLVVFGGEALDTGALRSWLDRYPESRCRLVNMYGITETTVHVTAHTVTRRDVLTGSRSVGRAIPGWYVHVLDERGRQVPCGAPGEIHVGGEGLALHYLDRDELTAERFVPDPFTGGRMYRSGDRGRLLPDGGVEHLGRLDSQVKVRGFRIELDEIRNVLLDDPAVLAAAVVVGGDAALDAASVRIDAYVVLDGGDPARVRVRAARVLPDYMVPTTVTALSALPLTSNGKVDTARLPEPSSVPSRVAEPVTAVARDLPSALIEVWESVLGAEVGLDDNFFHLGGNSLFAVRIAAAMRERDLPALPMRELYVNPTVRALAAVLGGRG